MNQQPATAIVVNDDVTQLTVLAGLLGKEGVGVHAYESAEAALAAMDPAAPPDLIVTDLYMPGIDGWRLCRLLRSPEYPAYNEVPILVVSATFAGDEASRITAELGANAFLSLPADGKRFGDTVRALRTGHQSQDTLRVLIVEDSRTLAKLLAKRFGEHGFRADVAENGREASARFAGAEYDVAVLDYHLPDVPGDVLLREFREKKPDCVCMMMTTDPDPGLAQGWMKAGAAGYLRKPFDPEYLIEQCARARREKALLRVEDLLEVRTRELRESEARFKLFSAMTWEGIVIHDNGIVLEANDQYFKMFGYRREELIGREGITRTTTPESLEFILQQIAKDALGPYEATGKRKDGTEFPIELLVRNIEYDGRTVRAAMIRDLTERKRLEAEQRDMEHRFRQMEKHESISRMAGAIAHLFNNQLAVVIGNLEMIAEDLPPDTGGLINLEDARQAAQIASETSRLMQAFLGLSDGNPAQLDLARACRMHLADGQSNIPESVTITATLPDPGPIIRADAAQLGQVIDALVTNAREAMDQTGEVRVVVQTFNAGDIPETHRFPVDWKPYAGSHACLEVTDTGRGMAPEAVDCIFDPFFTDKFIGRGLGLAVVLGIVKSLDGGITVASETGRGSTFRLFWPISSQPLLRPEAERDAGGRALEIGGTVLLVDDQEDVRKVGRAMFNRLGFEVITAKDGVEAVDIFRENPEAIRLVITDLDLPRLNGWETLKALRKIRPDVPVILASGYDAATAMAEYHVEQPQDFLHKPYQMDDLKAVLGEALAVTPHL